MAPSKRNRRAALRPFIDKWHLPPMVDTSAPREIPRPPFTIRALCAFAIKNSECGYMYLSTIYSFILHHFRHYRYLNDSWKNSVRHVLLGKAFRNEKVEKGNGKGEQKIYYLTNPDSIEKEFLGEKSFKRYMKDVDGRGMDFFQRLIDGKLGVPRQLFYHIVGLNMPCFAGPENSALFYYLLSLKHVFKPLSPLFREYCQTEHSGNEPRFSKDVVVFTQRDLSNPNNQKFYGQGLGELESVEELIHPQISRFHDNVDAYFRLQKDYFSRGIEHWETPRHTDVTEMVLEGPEQKYELCPRPFEYAIPGSIYWKEINPREMSEYEVEIVEG